LGVELDFDLLWKDENFTFSREDSFVLEFIPPPSNLAPYITTFFKFRSDSDIIRDVQPANTGHMMVFLSGHGEARFISGKNQKSQPVTLIGPTNAAMPYVVQGPFISFGCAFTPAGWYAITGLKAALSGDGLVDSEVLFGPDCDAFFQDLLVIEQDYEGSEQHQMMVKTATDFFVPNLRVINPKHQNIIEKTIAWLDSSLTPDLENLYPELPISRRQAQRVIGDYFGCTPKQLMRKYRAIRAAILLNDPNCSDEQEGEVLSLFYDQPHMVKEIRHFAGRTPARLPGNENNLLTMWLQCPSSESLRTIVRKT
jgi:AraC-like DNA-binding protein